MEKKNPNIYQRALDIINNRINPDIPQGGGGGGESAPEIENAIETHGLGWTEGEATTIEWDGDITGKTKHPVVPMYNISDIYVDKDTLVGAKIAVDDGTEYIISENDIDVSIEDGVTLNTISATIFGVDSAWILTVSDDYGSILPKGTYSVKSSFPGVGERYVSSLTYGNETIHKIDPKYIPGGSGGETLMVTLTPNESYTSGVADKRISEIYNAISSGTNVVLKLLFGGTAIYFPLSLAFPAEVGFGPYVTTEKGSACQIRATYNATLDADEWEMSL